VKTKLIFAGVAIVLLSGCASVFSTGGSSEFTCPGMPKGVICKTPRQVYDISTSKPVKGKRSFNPGPVEVTMSGMGENSEPVPVLEQARVMRIWIAPWHDSNNDLHWPGLIFTKIKGNDWAIGESDFNGIEPPSPRRISQGIPAMPQKAVKQDGSDQSRLPDVVLN